MKDNRKHKLVLISPNGREYQIGFLSPSKNGFVLGTTQIGEEETSHLTVIHKKGEISAHITPQMHPEDRQYFLPMNRKEIVARFQSLLENNLIFRLSPEQLTEEVLYITKKVIDWYDSLIRAFYHKKKTKKEVIHILDFKRLIKRLPNLIDEIKESPQSFIGLCKARDIFEDRSKIAGFNNARALIIPIDGELYGIDFSIFTSFDFTPSADLQEIQNPLVEVYKSMGIPQYMQEIQKKKFLERLIAKESIPKK
jgi:hypothetical protein